MSNNILNYDELISYYLDSILVLNKPVNDKRLPQNPNKKFIEHIKQASAKENYLLSYPMSVFWNLTSACNLRCVHCLYNNSSYNSDADLTASQASELVDELIDSGVTYVVLSGGEIFLRPDLLNILKKLKTNNIAVRLLTNAALINDDIIAELADLLNPYSDSVSVSLDGATSKTFKAVRNTDLFEKIITNIKKMSDKNIKVTVVCTVNAINYDEIVDTYKLAKDLGAYNFIVGKTDCYNESHAKICVSNEELFDLYYKLSLIKDEKCFLDINFWSPIELLNIPEVYNIIESKYYETHIKKIFNQVQDRNCQCHDRLAIDSDGTVYLCLEAIANKIAPLGNYKQNSISDIWQNRFNNPLFNQRKIENMECDGCKYNIYCNSGCVVKSFVATNNINNPQIMPCRRNLF